SIHVNLMDHYLKDQKQKQKQHEQLKEQKIDYINAKRTSPWKRDSQQKILETKTKKVARETKARKRKRADSEVREKEAARETPCRRRKRADSEVRGKEAARDRIARQTKRADSEVRGKEAARETPCRRRKRADSEVRGKEAAIDRIARQTKRADSKVRGKEAARETPCRRRKRADSEVRGKEAARDRIARQTKRADSEVRGKEAARDRIARQTKRADSEVRGKEAARDRIARQKKRGQSEIQEKEAARETPCRRRKRADSEVRGKEAATDRIARQTKRADSEVRGKEAARETPAKRQKRALPGDETAAINHFKQEIQNGPTYVCTCCCKLLYRNSVIEFKEIDFEGCSKDLLTSCRKQKDTPKEHICNLFEKEHGTSFVSSKQHGQRVVNVPIEPEESVSVLPRVASPDSMVLVKVKRKLEYRGHAYKQNVHPNRVKDALHVLKHSLKNPLYSDVVVDNDWEQNSANSDENLWNALISLSSDQDENNNLTEKTGDEAIQEEQESEEEEEDERSKLSGLQFNTCLQPKDITTDANLILNIAPGEGKRPRTFLEDEYSEQLSFPQLFPTGKFGFSMARQQKVTMRKYFQAQILHHDGRFSRNPEYLFYAQYRCEAKDIHDCLSVALRKGRVDNITVKDIKQRVADIIHSDLGIHFLQKVRGSPAYFNKMLYDLLGMIRQLGPCTWFITLSAADLKWHDTIQIIAEQQGKILSEDEIENLSWEERSGYLRANPVTAARHFNNRVQLFLKHILLNKELQPLGEITDYKYRIEFQQRGSPHVHMLAWIKDPPSFESNSEDEIQQFLDKHVTCELPKEDEKLRDTLLHVQKHTHSVACRKHGKACRFQFPRWPVCKTLALKPLQESPAKTCQELFTKTLETVNKQLQETDTATEMTFEELMRRSGVSEESYLKALHWIKTKSGQPAVLLKRSPNEGNINNYNTTLMKCCEANLDVQFVTNTFACVMYVASYVSKPEKTLGDVLKAVSKSSVNLGVKTSMKTVAKKFLTHREISAQEATFRLLSLPLVQGSRQIVYIPTDLPQHRTRLMKPLKMLEKLDDDDTDVYMTGLLDRYAARPRALDNMFLADFAAKYRYSGGKKSRGTSDEDSCDHSITLQNQMGSMSFRKTPAIIRSHQWSVKKQPEQYYHSQPLLYFPWRKETDDLCRESFQNSYMENLEVIEENRAMYQQHADEVDMAVENLDQTGDPEEAWNVLAPQTQQDRADREEEGQQAIDSVMNAFEPGPRRTVDADIGVPQFEVEFTVENMTTSEYYSLIASLNKLQSELHQFVVDWCSKMLLSHRVPAPEPFYIFLTGGAGVGKSHVVRAIVQTATRLLMRSGQEDETHVLVCAPTGAAAYNVSGYTLHSAFHATHIFAYNKNVNDHNLDKLKSLSTTVYTFRAQDSKKDEQTGCIDTTNFREMSGKYSKVTAKRVQFPLTLAWGLTIHKEQGKTEDRLVVACEGSFHPGQFYTAISRTKDISGLFFLGNVSENKIKVNVPALQEIKRMKKSACFTQALPDSLYSFMEVYFKLLCLNVNSLKPHWESLCKDGYLLFAHIACLSETWINTTEPSPTIPKHSTLMTSTKTGRGGGLAMFIHDDLLVLKQWRLQCVKTEHQFVIVSPKLMPTLRLCILSFYHNRSLEKTSYHNLKGLFQLLPKESLHL
ncbi:PIF1-like protein, partial [Mya arenaria]